jgi:hypothetical protein
MYCALSNGSSFGTVTLWESAFSDAAGWNQPKYYETIRLADISGDGLADLCGRGPNGVECALSSGSAPFRALSTPVSAFSDAAGFAAGPQYYSTIEFPDINGDGLADVCGRAPSGVQCAVSTSHFGAPFFATPTTWASFYSDSGGFSTAPYYSTIRYADINGDGFADICGRSPSGIECATSNGVTTFGAVSLWQGNFTDHSQWNLPQYYTTIALVDVNNDGKADLCARGSAGIDCAESSGTGFGSVSTWQSAFSDANGWNSADYYSTIQFGRLP